MKIQILKLTDKAVVPTRANLDDAGWDIYSSEDISILPGERGVVSTSIAMSIPNGFVGLVWPRSGLAVKKGVDVFAGVIDSGYRGEIKVCLYNSSNEIFHISQKDRIAQMLIQAVSDFSLQETETLDSTQRGDEGFGSSGK
jgi:dUTP pyrophosphatase